MVSFEFFRNGLRILSNVHPEQTKTNQLTLFSFHGNSSCAETFSEIIKTAPFQVIACDLPGCGKSMRLAEYSMDVIAGLMAELVKSFRINANKIVLFGHSLGGHLVSQISAKLDDKIAGIAIAGTPALSSAADFALAFDPTEENKKLVPMLMMERSFTHQEAELFVGHTGVEGDLLELMVAHACGTDGKFRSGCLGTLADFDQKSHLQGMKNVIIFHAIFDGVINPDYLEQINKNCLFEDKIHYLECRHMSPIEKASEIVDVVVRCFGM